MKNLFYPFKSSEHRFLHTSVKKLSILSLMLVIGIAPVYNQAFITTWRTNYPGTSSPTSITIPTLPDLLYNYDVDWNNDGVYDSHHVTGNITHDYGTPGTYTIRIRGVFPAIYFNNSGDKAKIISINQWGNIEWTTMVNAFYGACNLRLDAKDTPYLSHVRSLRNMFREATSLNSDLSTWDVSKVTDMLGMLNDTGMSIENYDKTLIGWADQGTRNLVLGAHGLIFCQGDDARNQLVSKLGWTINGDSYDCSSLPIILLTFSTRLTWNNEVLLKWETASEVNNLGFEVKKSMDCKCWQVIGCVEGYGTKDLNSHYTFVDKNPNPGVNYYVLRQLDRNGDDTYSDIQSVYISLNERIEIFPNPTNGLINIIGDEIDKIQVLDPSGKRIKTFTHVSKGLDISDLDGGLYIVAIHTLWGIIHKRVVKN